ncbi:MAG: phosphodiester glycosidase family protein, partial [Lentisphaeria bacterium]|nr:phosphodiester glycosidase family protein [Lentisphaeria bacterium]
SLLLGVAAGAADWNSAKTLYPGIKLLEVKKTKPRLLRLFIMRIDLKTPGLTFAVTGRAENWGKPMPDYPKLPIRTRRATTGEFMRECRNPVAQGGRGLNMVVAVNASPWTPWAPPFTHKFADPPGLNISDGVIVGNRRGNNPVFVVYRDGSVDIVSKVPRSDIPRIKDAVSGFFLLVKNGKVLPDTGVTSRECHPRTAYGLSADRRYLYIMALDGRQRKWSLGATGSETGRFLLEAGASDVINMDGGGSTTLCYWDKRRKKPVMVNRQSSTGNSMRPVATNLGIVLNRK